MAPMKNLAPPPPPRYRIVFSRGGHLPAPKTPICLDTTPEAGPLPAPTLIPTIRDWAYLLHTHTHEEFAALAHL